MSALIGLAGGVLLYLRERSVAASREQLYFEFRGRFYRTWLWLQQIDPLEILLGLLAVVLVVGIWMLRSTKRF
jgi:hypothetical protein